MPKKFSEADKNGWLELFEKGKSEKWIANQAKCDWRTVKNGIDEARRRQDSRLARAELLKEALRKHQDRLLEGLDVIFSDLSVPPEDFAPLSWSRGTGSIFTEPGVGSQEIQVSDATNTHGKLSAGLGTVGELLKQHLKKDRLWKILAQWEKAYKAHLTSRIELQRKTVAILEEVTGYKVLDQNDVTKPYVCSYTAGDLFYRSALKHAFNPDTNIDLKADLVTDEASGDVRFRNSILAEAPGNEAKLRDSLLDAFQKLESAIEIGSVVETYATLKETTIKARQVVEQVRLFGLILGQCQICRRLGM